MDIEVQDPEDEDESGAPEDRESSPDDPEEEIADGNEELAGAEGSLEADVLKWRELAMRNQADLENYRKRMAREKSEAVQYANVSLLRSLLPILDNFDMGLQAAKAEGEESIIYQGMVMVKKQIDEFLSEEGVEAVESVGAEFDPNRHEAVQQEWSDDEPEGTIIGELRRGYRMGERLLRPANVIVSKGPEPESEAAEDAAAEGED